MTIDDAIKCARERVEESRDMYVCLLETSYQYQMKHKEEMDNYKQCAEEHEQLAEWLEELKKYKYAEEQGLLLKLPCKVGDTIYQPLIDGQINEYKVIGLVYDIVKNEWAFEVATQIGLEWMKTVCHMEFIGKTVFLTKEEAEQKLKEMESDK